MARDNETSARSWHAVLSAEEIRGKEYKVVGWCSHVTPKSEWRRRLAALNDRVDQAEGQRQPGHHVEPEPGDQTELDSQAGPGTSGAEGDDGDDWPSTPEDWRHGEPAGDERWG